MTYLFTCETRGNHSGRRSIQSIGRSRDRIDRFDRFDNFSDFLPRRGARDLSAVKVSALYDAWRPKKRRKTKTKKFGFFVKFDSIDSIIRSIRSIMCRWAMVDRPDCRCWRRRQRWHQRRRHDTRNDHFFWFEALGMLRHVLSVGYGVYGDGPYPTL